MLPERHALSSARRTIERSIEIPVIQEHGPDHGIDACFRVGDVTFLVEVKANARGSTVSEVVAAFRPWKEAYPQTVPLLVVPSMGATGAQICERSGINWIDLHGNASIHEKNIRVYIRGLKNKDDTLTSADKSALNPFSRKAARVVHTLLTDPKRAWARSELSHTTALDKGYISKIIAALSERNHVAETFRGKRSIIQVVDPIVLLDAWTEHYKRDQPVYWGLIAARDGFETVEKLGDILNDAGVTFALTGLASAAAYSKFGSFRRVDVYAADILSEKTETQLRAGTDQRGRNVAIYVDASNASIGTTEKESRRLASPVITYLDLAAMPERAQEARIEMRKYLETQWQ